jgi:hypothetical protein
MQILFGSPLLQLVEVAAMVGIEERKRAVGIGVVVAVGTVVSVADGVELGVLLCVKLGTDVGETGAVVTVGEV